MTIHSPRSISVILLSAYECDKRVKKRNLRREFTPGLDRGVDRNSFGWHQTLYLTYATLQRHWSLHVTLAHRPDDNMSYSRGYHRQNDLRQGSTCHSARGTTLSREVDFFRHAVVHCNSGCQNLRKSGFREQAIRKHEVLRAVDTELSKCLSLSPQSREARTRMVHVRFPFWVH